MAIRLGLDIGTNSVGYAIVDINEEEKLQKIIAVGSRIIKEEDIHKKFVEGKTASKCSERTKFRGTRRLYHRYVMRREKLKSILKEYGMFSKNLINIGQGIKKQESERILYKLRSDAAEKQISLEEFGRVLYLLVQRRGFKSNRKDTSSKDTKHVSAIKENDKNLGDKTIGQYLYDSVFNKTIDENDYDSYSYNDDTPTDTLTQSTVKTLRRNIFSRAKYEEEFNKIWDTQSKFYPEILSDELKNKIGKETLFYQRPLKSCKHLVSKCPFYPNLKVVPKSSPLFQIATIWQTINNIEIGIGREKINLSLEQKQKLFYELNTNKSKLQDKYCKISKDKILKHLGYNPREVNSFNYKEGIKGNKTLRDIADALKKGGVDSPEQYLHFDYKNLQEKGGLYHIWQMLFSISDPEELKNALRKNLGFNDQEIKYLTDISFNSDYGSLSPKVLRKILPFLEQGYMYSESMEKAGYNHSKKEFIEKDIISLLKPNELRNPVVTQVINQTINIVNAIIKKYGKPDEIVVELARELKKTAKERQQITEAVNRDKKYHEKIVERLKEGEEYPGKEPSKSDILRYKLREQTGGICLYSGNKIGIGQLYNGDTEIEHVIPKSRMLDDSQNNKIIVFREENKAKGQMTAYEYMESKGEQELLGYLNRIKTYRENYQECIDGKKRGINGIKEKNLKKTSKDLEKEDDFVSAQANDTAYISTKTVELLNDILPLVGDKKRVLTTSGTITDKLREDWGLLNVLEELNEEKYGNVRVPITIKDSEKNEKTIYRLKIGEKEGQDKLFTKRDDQRHHALDALITALTTHKIIHRLNNAHRDFRQEQEQTENKEERTRDFKKSNKKFEDLIPHSNLRGLVRDSLEKILISYNKPKRKAVIVKKDKKNKKASYTIAPKGELHKDTVFKKIKIRGYEDKSLKDILNSIESINFIANKYTRKEIKKYCRGYDNDTDKIKKALKEKPIKTLDKDGAKEIELGLKDKVKIWKEMEVFSKRKDLSQKFNEAEVKKILDKEVKDIILERIKERGGLKEAFKNLDKDPILNKNGHIIKSVRLWDNQNLTNVNIGKEIPKYVSLQNNHHAVIYKSDDGKLDDEVVSLFKVIKEIKNNFENKGKTGKIIDRFTPNENGYKPIMSLQENDLFYFGTELKTKEEFLNPLNRKEISKNLFRVQKLSQGDYYFRHHLETNVNGENNNNIVRHITSLGKLPKTKLHIDNLGGVIDAEIYDI